MSGGWSGSRGTHRTSLPGDTAHIASGKLVKRFAWDGSSPDAPISADDCHVADANPTPARAYHCTQ